MPSNHFILCHSLLLLPSVFPSIRVFPNESVLRIRWLKYWSFSFSISPSNEYSGLISFRTDWLDLLVAQGTLKSLLQHHSSKASSNIGHLSRNFPSISKQHRWLPLLCYSKVILQRSHSEMDFPNMVPFRTSLVPQWLRICLPVDMGLILGLGRSHMLWSS